VQGRAPRSPLCHAALPIAAQAAASASAASVSTGDLDTDLPACLRPRFPLPLPAPLSASPSLPLCLSTSAPMLPPLFLPTPLPTSQPCSTPAHSTASLLPSPSLPLSLSLSLSLSASLLPLLARSRVGSSEFPHSTLIHQRHTQQPATYNWCAGHTAVQAACNTLRWEREREREREMVEVGNGQIPLSLLSYWCPLFSWSTVLSSLQMGSVVVQWFSWLEPTSIQMRRYASK